MFESLFNRNDFRYAFEKISAAVADPSADNVHAATHLGLNILSAKFGTFRQELDVAGAIGEWRDDLDTYEHCLGVLERYLTGNPDGLNGRDARIYCRYLRCEYVEFTELARDLADRIPADRVAGDAGGKAG
ncbi:hypothetical protein [Pantoea sp. At-9b]|jgi:hypothetical protein|uniref:hypothetical protein n=1 Tax=Pantoea sp. (strain At-9b) TaxID=592316 RepID=UPI0001B40109|nr:hypothetical protein [Pantoea sp. At-9b]ADU72150.1 conserved hypothetical protein, putative helix-turn-helix, fis-type [Pantoea sp. At-9b]